MQIFSILISIVAIMILWVQETQGWSLKGRWQMTVSNVDPPSSKQLQGSKGDDVPLEKLKLFVQPIDVQAAEVASFDMICGAMRGMRATKSIENNAQIVSLPFQSTLTATSSKKNTPPGLDQLWALTTSPPDRLAVILLQEFLKGTQSKWYEYIRNLPSSGDRKICPINWSDDFLLSFPYSPLTIETLKQKKNWEKLYSNMIKTTNMKEISYERFVWAMEAVASRAFQGNVDVLSSPLDNLLPIAGSSLAVLAALVGYSKNMISDEKMVILCSVIVLGGLALQRLGGGGGGGSSCALLPVIDSANHRSTNPSCSLSVTSKDFVMSSNRGLRAGEEITISYGNRDNDALLQYFGFIEQNNIYDRYVILQATEKLSAVIESDMSRYEDLQREMLADQRNYEVLKKKVKKSDRLVLDMTTFPTNFIEANEEVFNNVLALQNFSAQKKQEIVIKLIEYEGKVFANQCEEYVEKYCRGESNELHCWVRLFLQEKQRVLDKVKQKLSVIKM